MPTDWFDAGSFSWMTLGGVKLTIQANQGSCVSDFILWRKK